MMEFLARYKIILLIAVLVVVGFVAYSMFFGGTTDSRLLTSTPTANQAQTSTNNELLLLLVNLKTITLESSIFGDSAFQGLVDFGQGLVPEPAGRKNPFAPVGANR